MPPILAEGLVRRFGKIVAVDGIDLSVGEGEIFGFLGPNGAGKSTTVRMFTTLLKPTAGKAFVAGYDVSKQPDRVRRSIGVALQDAAIDPLMSGRELLQLQATLHGMTRLEGDKRAGELLEIVGLVGAADRRVGTYSSGMRRRLDVALALVHDPTVLFLDEPTTGLDPNSRQAVWDQVRELNRERGATIFLTTQYMEEADRLAGRVAIIDDGKIIKEGTPAKMKAEVGDPTLSVVLANPKNATKAQNVLKRFGELATAPNGSVAVRLPGGPEKMGEVLAALDRSRIKREGIELHAPTLDDVFQMVTGRRLEGAGEASEGPSSGE